MVMTSVFWGCLLLASAFADRYTDYAANKVLYTNNEEISDDASNDRVLCTELGSADCTETASLGWNRMREHYFVSADAVSYSGTMEEIKVLGFKGTIYKEETGPTPYGGHGWAQRYTFWAITDSTGWANNFTVSGTVYRMHKLAIYESSINTGSTLLIPVGDFVPPNHSFKTYIYSYYTGGSNTYTYTGGSGVGTAFASNNEVYTTYDRVATAANNRFTCWASGSNANCGLGGSWKKMRPLYLPSTADSAYGSSVTYYKLFEWSGYHRLSTGTLSGWTQVYDFYLITNRSTWPDAITVSGVGTYKIREFRFLYSPHYANPSLIVDGADSVPSGYTHITYFWAYYL